VAAEFLASADRQTFRPRPCDVGSMHVALEVDDIDSVVESCRAHGVLPVGPVQTLEEEPAPGARLIYLHVPDGVTIELIQPPKLQGEASPS
jgi:catechol 2,3-dioxygenase-like lactoylglutathione lyase family enzyme